MEKSESDMFYVGISHPLELRRTILEGSRDVLRSLQRYERVRLLREKRFELMMVLKNTMKDIDKLNNQIKLGLPKAPVFPAKRIREEKKQPVAERKLTHIDRLSAELEAIESKLDRLSHFA